MRRKYSVAFQADSGNGLKVLYLLAFCLYIVVFCHCIFAFCCYSLYFVFLCVYVIPTKQCLKSSAPCRVIYNNERDNNHNENE